MIQNDNVDPIAAIEGWKANFGVSTTPSVASDLDTGLLALAEGQIIWANDADVLKVYDGSTWQSLQSTAPFGGTWDAVASAGKKITSVAEVEIEKSDAAMLFILDQNGDGGCLTLENAGTAGGSHTLVLDDGGTTWATFGTGGAKQVDITQSGVLDLADSSVLQFGTGDDITIQWDGTDLLIDGAAADTIIKIGATNNQDLIIYGDTATDLVTFDTSAELCTFNGFDLRVQDADILSFGDADDITIRWDATDLLIDGAAADTIIKIGATNNQDLIIYGDTATDLVTFDTSAELCHFNGFDLQLKDSDHLLFGDAAGGDMDIAWDGTDLLVEWGTTDTGAIKFGATATGDVYFYGATNTNYVQFNTDDSALKVTFEHFHLELQDASDLRFGDADDITIQWDGTDLLIDGAAADTIIKIGATNNQDLIIYGDTATDLITFDTSAELVHFNGFDLQLKDSDNLSFGDAKDVSVLWDGTDLLVEWVADDTGIIKFGATNAGDVAFYGSTNSKIATFDAGAGKMTLAGGYYIEPTAIADPGNAGAIAVTVSGYVPLVTAGAETRTMAAPTYIGQECNLYFKTDGPGDCVVTIATTVNQTGNNTLTFADEGDHILLQAVESGANKRWRVVANDGVALATV